MGVAAALAETNDGDGVASETDEGVDGARNDTKKPKESGEQRVIGSLSKELDCKQGGTYKCDTYRLEWVAALNGTSVAAVSLLRSRCGGRKENDEGNDGEESLGSTREHCEEYCLWREVFDVEIVGLTADEEAVWAEDFKAQDPRLLYLESCMLAMIFF